jgi:glycosyltransferase involved in cell wall biosynthesis
MGMSVSSPLSIGIDARAAAEEPAGRGRVVRELLRALAQRADDHRYILYARETEESLELDERFRWHLVPSGDPLWHLRAAHHANGECDVFLSSNSYLTVWFLRIPSVPIVYDMATFDAAMRPKTRSAVIERATLGLAVRRSAAIIAISRATADALATRFPRAAEHTVVAPLGITASLTEQLDPIDDSQLPAPGFVLAVGTLEPRKNLPRLVDAYARLFPELQSKHPLVVVGAAGWETGETLAALGSLGERCTTLGHVPDAALAELYRRCAVFCYPSLGEGFGLPVLEAMAAGAAVLTSNVSSLPEVGGDAVAYVDPRSVEDIADKLQALLSDERWQAELRNRARSRAKGFSWADFAERVLGTLVDVATDSPRSSVRESLAAQYSWRV